MSKSSQDQARRDTIPKQKARVEQSQTKSFSSIKQSANKPDLSALLSENGPIKTADPTAGLRALLDIEAEIRRASTRKDLAYIIANETRKLTNARQIFVFKLASKMRLTTISGLPSINRSAAFIHDIERILNDIEENNGLAKRHELALDADQKNEQDSLDSYPFRRMLWVPFLGRSGEVVGGMLLAREQLWADSDIRVADRLAETYQHALALLMAEPQTTAGQKVKSVLRRKWLWGIVTVTLIVMAIPVPMSTLAPLEIVAHNPYVVAAPIEGVIEEVLVNPGEKVTKNQVIVKFSDTIVRNRLELAQREVLVAEAHLKKASQLAFNDKSGRHELRLVMADLELKRSELDFALDMFERASIKAQRSGIAVYSDKQGLIGKPLALGERIMRIADPAQIEVVIQIAVGDAIMLKPGARVKVFLDSDPLHTHEAIVNYSDYQAAPISGAGEKIAFRVVARFTDSQKSPPGLGVRGTAQIFGEQTILALYLFRRPLSALRQWVGL